MPYGFCGSAKKSTAHRSAYLCTMNQNITPNRLHTQPSATKKKLSLSKIASGIFLLIVLFTTTSKSVSAGTITVNSDNGAFSAIITVTATSLNKTPNGTSNFNYTINLSYSISFTGNVPAGFSLYNIAGIINDYDGQTGFPLPSAGGSGATVSYTQTHPAFSDFATANPASVGATQALITLAGPNISATNVSVGLSAAMPLPVQVKTFTAVPSNEGVQVAWETAPETQVQSFTIERSSNGTQWNAVGTVAAKGSAAAGAFYTLNDRESLEGNSYYRLSEADLNGMVTYCNTVVVRKARESETPRLFPNPNTGNAVHLTGLEGKGQWQLSITGADAQNKGILSVTDGNVNLPELSAGLYFLSLRNTVTGVISTFRYSKL